MGKSDLVAAPAVKAQTRKQLAPSKISALFVWFGRIAAPVYLRIVLRFRKIEIQNPQAIVKALCDFQEKKTRLIIAFRHAYGDEPQLLFHVFETLVPRQARKLHMPLRRRPAVRPIHDFAVGLWGGAVTRFVLPRVGALPIHHSKYDPKMLNNIRGVMRDGNSPLSLAPEGQISYHSETLPRIEQGTIRMGFWCAKDIEKAKREEHVMVLPLSIHYRYDIRDLAKIRAALDELEMLCGMKQDGMKQQDDSLQALLPRIEAIESSLLEITEAYYTKTYGYQPSAETNSETESAAMRHNRWMALLPFAIGISENILGIQPVSDDTDQRMYTVRQVAWDRIFPEQPVEDAVPLEAALLHRRAGEAWHAMCHMELVDVMSYDDADYFDTGNTSDISFDKLVETVVGLQDVTFRLMGGNITTRPNVIRKSAVIVPGTPIDLTANMPQYKKNPKQTAAILTEELSESLKNCIEVYHHGQ